MVALRLLCVLSVCMVFKRAQPACCPTCSLLSITPLNAEQIAQIKSNREFINEIQQNPALLRNQTFQRSVFNLTQRQEYQIGRNFPNLFLSVKEFEGSRMTRGTITVPGGEGTEGSARRRRTLAGEAVCQWVAGSDPLILVSRPGSSQVVELIQMPGQGKNQWILEESCDDAASTPPTTLACGLVERHVPAFFANLNPPYAFDYAYVVVQSCVTIYG